MTTREVAVVGAGLSGAVLARELADSGHFRVVVFEERPYVGGNCHCFRDPESGVMIHEFGPHVFHTSREDVWQYIRRWDEFRPYTSRVKAVTERGVFSLPINLLTINQFFGLRLDPRQAELFMAGLGEKSIQQPRTFEEQALHYLGRELYQAFFYGYTKKQWGIEPAELPSSILARLPVRFNYDDSYYNDTYSAIPVHGYTHLVENLLDHPHLDVHVGRPFGRSDAQDFDHVFYTGSLDRWFECDVGPLGYRSLLFERLVERGDHQGNAQINYCEEKVPYTRVTEFKHFTPWEDHELTVCFRETSVPARASDPLCYPLPFGARAGPITEYLERAHRERHVTFLGRLATYRYLDMHVVVAEALDLARKVLEAPESAERWPRFTDVPVPFEG